MSVQLAVILGLGIITLLIFDMWRDLRKEHPQISMLVFGIGLAGITSLSYVVSKIIAVETDVSYLSNVGLAVFEAVMWLSILIAVWIMIMQIWYFLKNTINWIFESIGMGKILK